VHPRAHRLLQTPRPCDETFATWTQRRFQDGAMLGLGRPSMTLGALLQEAHQFIVQFAYQQGCHHPLLS
jgi:hypothetical protein